MIGALLLSAALMVSPTVSDDGWLDYPNVLATKKFVLHDSPISAYQGRFHRDKYDGCRYLIRHRESRHQYSQHKGPHTGAYQFTEALGIGAAWMVQAELRKTGTPKAQAIHIGRTLRANPAWKWNIFYQDFAWAVVWNHGKGKSHWPTAYGSECAM